MFKPHSKNRTGPVNLDLGSGPDFGLGPAPRDPLPDRTDWERVALLGRDYPGTRFRLLVEEGQQVRAGEPVLCDRRHEQIKFVSSVSGTVKAVNRGVRRAMVSMEIQCSGDNEVLKQNVPDPGNPQSLRELMQLSGLWTTLRTRPYGQIPSPEQDPGALLVTAVDTEPLAPDPDIVIEDYRGDFSRGLETLAAMVDCEVYLCAGSQSGFQPDGGSRVQNAVFSGGHPAGLPGIHINALCPIGLSGKPVWHIGYQDVISIGRFMDSGCPWLERIISVAGPAVRNPGLVKVPLGVSISELVSDNLLDANAQVVSGSILSGHLAVGTEGYLGQRHRQVTALTDDAPTAPGNGAGTSLDPMLPVTELDRVAPPGILATPLMRALLVGDVDRARDLGALELVEEDVVMLSYTCPSGSNYGRLLRKVLDQLYSEGA